ncbi:MAG TPA: hypothetical protein VHT51_07810 [Micropepsaceae bacterium]|jgi:uncharacterized membrane protein|nr:hypothetical protein [Micropepsaceae bacterium]
MTVIPPAPSSSVPPNDAAGGASDLRSLAIVCYVLFLLAGVNGVTAFIGLIIAYVKRRDALGTVWHSHFSNLILVFWVMVGAVVLAFLTWPFAIGVAFFSWHVFWPSALSFPFVFWFVGMPLLAVWYYYRLIRGVLRASEERPY